MANALVSAVLAAVTHPDPFEQVRSELAERDALLGQEIITEAGSGHGAGIDAGGALLLRRRDGVVVPVHAGSVRLTAAGGSE